MKRSEYSLLLLSVWGIASALAEGWFQLFALGISAVYAVTLCLWLYVEHVDAKTSSEWQETWHR